jgi:hypothetical protein
MSSLEIFYFPINPGTDTKAASYFTVKNNWKPILRAVGRVA